MRLPVNCLRRAALLGKQPVGRTYVEISRYFRSASRLPVSARPLVQCAHFSSSLRFANNATTPALSQEVMDLYKLSFNFPKPTHEISEISNVPIGTDITVHGYLGQRADLSKNLAFVPLLSKELRYSVQIISTAKASDGILKSSHVELKKLNYQTPVVVKGTIKKRKPAENEGAADVEKINNVEIELTEIRPLNEFPRDIIVTDETRFPPEQRHLQIRTDKTIRDALAFRARAADICREELRKQGFTEIETPILFKSTPEGAREFLVPTRNRGLAYALPQSPQQYKQILMASGISRYFQIARCFRDEDLRADRQPEFTQIDLEMAFATGEDVMVGIEILIRELWSKLLGANDLPAKFPEMSYLEAMAKYGSDKPDIRLGMEIRQIDHLLPAELVSKIGPLATPAVDVMKLHISDRPAETRQFVSEFMDSSEAAPFIANPDGQPGIFVYDSRKPLGGLQAFGFEAAERLEEEMELEEGDLVILQARQNLPFSGGSTPVGNLRLVLHKAAVKAGLVEAPKGFEFLWITGFPLFSPTTDADPGQGGSAGLSSTHHPFTAPKTEQDFDLLFTDPSRVQAEHYDIVVNGVELGGGSRRIHNAQVQEFILRNVLKMSEERLQDFRHLIEVLRAGCPPHAGIALGFDRLVAVLLGRDSVRDVIAFPKSGKGEDLLVKAPNMMTEEQLSTYNLKLK